MNKFKATILTIVIALFSIYSAPNLYANVFAHNVRITQPDNMFPFDGNFSDGSGAWIRFTLSDNADTVNINIYDSGMNMVRSILVEGLSMGDNAIEWDGMDDGGSMVADDNYSLEIYTASAGYDAYTVLHDEEVGIFTRGVTSVTTQTVKNFGFTYSASGGGYASGVTRHTNDMAQYGDVPGDATLSVTYTDDFSTVGSDNLRYSSEADDDGYVYVARRSSTVQGIYRYHVDTLSVELVDSGAYGDGNPQGIAIGGTGSEQIIIVSTSDGKVHSFLNDGSTTAHTKEMMIDDPNAIFWDITTGDKDGWLYATYQAPDTSFLPGVAAFDFSAWVPGVTAPFTLADAVWTVEGPDTATANTITYSDVDGQLYLTFARQPHSPNVQGIYTIKDLEGTPTLELVYLDPEDNMTQFRSDVAVDAAGNVIFFENSNEFITLISPPTGPNSYLYKDMFTSIQVFASESIADVKVDANEDGMPDRLAEVVTVQGVVTSYSFSEGKNIPVTIQDATGGIYLFGANVDGAYKLGDILLVTGAVAFYNGLTEIDVAAVEDISVVGHTIPVEPMELTLLEWLANPEMYESMLISVKALAKVSGDWPAEGVNMNITMTDGVQEFTMRVDKDLDLDGQVEPTYPINLTGVTSQFSSAAPYNTGHQIFPRMYADIEQGVAAAPNANYALLTPEDGATIVVTDSTDEFTATWEAAVDLNSDDIIYQWKLTDDSFASGALTEPSFTFTGEDLYGLLGTTWDSVTVSWTVICKGAEPAFIASVDTFSVKFINGLVVGVDGESIPNKFFVDQNYPNPFNPTTTIKFGLPAESVVDLRIYDILGREVVALVSNKSLKAGTHSYDFNASNIASGTYIYRLTTDNNVVTKKMLLLK